MGRFIGSVPRGSCLRLLQLYFINLKIERARVGSANKEDR